MIGPSLTIMYQQVVQAFIVNHLGWNCLNRKKPDVFQIFISAFDTDL